MKNASILRILLTKTSGLFKLLIFVLIMNFLFIIFFFSFAYDITEKRIYKGGGPYDTFAYIWLSGFILRLTVKVILDKS